MSKRPFQFHLSTALIAVLIGGAFLGLNIHPERTVKQTMEGKNYRLSKTYSLGWPLAFYSSVEDKGGLQEEDGGIRFNSSGNGATTNILKFFANLLLCAVIIRIFVRLADHFMIRRKQSEKKDYTAAHP